MGINSSASSVFNLELDNSNGKMMVQDADAEVESVDEDVYQSKPSQEGESKKMLRDQLRRTLSRTTVSSKPRPAAHWLPDARRSFNSKLSPREYFILTDAGKPVFISRGMDTDDSDISSMIGIMQALMSVFIDDGDKLKSINAGKTRITFLQRPPLYYVCVSSWGEPESVARSHLEYLHLQIISVVTAAQLKRIFERRGNFDLRRLLGGADTFLTTMISRLQLDLAISMSALRCLRLDPALRNKCAQALVPSGKIIKGFTQDILYIILVARGEIITLVRPKKHSVHPADIHILLTTLAAPSITNSLAAAMWVPVCLPKWNEGRMVNAYVVNMPSLDEGMTSEPSFENHSGSSSPDLNVSGPPDTDGDGSEFTAGTSRRTDSSPVADTIPVTLVCISGGSDFDSVRAWCDEAVEKLSVPSLSSSSSTQSSTLTVTPHTSSASQNPPSSQSHVTSGHHSGFPIPPSPATPSPILHPTSNLYMLHSYIRSHSAYTVSELGVPGLRHFVYKARGLVQVTFPVWEDDVDARVDMTGSAFASWRGNSNGNGKGKGKGKERQVDPSGNGNEDEENWDSSSESDTDYGADTVILTQNDQEDERRRIVTLYQIVHDAIHAKGMSGQAKGDAKEGLKLQYLRTEKEGVLGWITQPFELYLTLSPLMPKSAAIGAANAVARWVKKEEGRLFLRDAPVF
ncbi:hypothetical protein GYMLUDRAFT_61477 [Collybiopsis luxurians FD-317 M1]|uniref:Vacuolar fusion protein MON1 n=1 Tax=Collybiopsis luxurians FD-317 M1 TaxID=944289 RepID=A0A0D0CG90_9AGAR|nr:hypothetical protein GYMLUDRAFT_61477 [Collybiopsis luxurians FD-317 M1]